MQLGYDAERIAALPDWLHTYNHHRGYTALKGNSPADRVPNLRRQNSSVTGWADTPLWAC